MSRRARYLYLCFLLVISGAAVMGIEVVWARTLQRLLGSTSFAVATVLAGFLLGMGAGAHFVGRFLRHGSARSLAMRPLVGYGVCELSAAAFALLATVLLHQTMVRSLPFASVWLLALVVAATLPIGATFPLLVSAVQNGFVGVGGSIERCVRQVYGVGALGAAIGGITAGLLLIPHIGEWNTLLCLTTAQVCVGLAVLHAFRNVTPSNGNVLDSPPELPASPSETFATHVPMIAFLFLSGWVVFFWEVLWTRLLVLVIGGTVYAFAVVTGSVVLGIGLGSLLLSPLRLVRHAAWVLPFVVTVLTLIGYMVVPLLPEAYLVGVRASGASPLVCGTVGAALLVFVPNFLLGCLFPSVLSHWSDRAGSLYAINSVGAVAGAFIAGPATAGRVSLEDTYHIGVASLLSLTFVGGVWVRAGARSEKPSVTSRGVRAVVVVALCVVAGCLVALGARSTLFKEPWDPKRLLSGVYQWPLADLRDETLSVDKRFEGRRLLTLVSGAEVIVSVELDELANTVYVKGNGKVEGSVPADPTRGSLADLPTQVLLGELAADLSWPAAPENALLIGLGSGVTLNALLEGAGKGQRPDHVDVIELEPAFLQALAAPEVRSYLKPFVPDWLVQSLVSDGMMQSGAPNCVFHFGDARRLLGFELSDRRWDVIVSQPSEPWIPAAAPLFTREFFATVRQRLTPEGFFLQWLQLYKLDASTLRVLVRTLRREFPEVFLVRPPASGQVILVATQKRPQFDRLLSVPPGPLQSRTLVEAPEDRLAIFLGGSAGVDHWIGLGPELRVNTDDRDVALRLTKSLYSQKNLASVNLATLRENIGADPIVRYLGRPLQKNVELVRRLALRNARVGDFEEALATIDLDPSPEGERLRAEILRAREARNDRRRRSEDASTSAAGSTND